MEICATNPTYFLMFSYKVNSYFKMMDTVIKQEITEKPPAREVILTWKEKPKETSKCVDFLEKQSFIHYFYKRMKNMN